MTECKSERKRAYAPKTRTGCRTCKLRRIKCDETKPFCKRCTSTGRRCDGYNPNQQSLVPVRPLSILPKSPFTTVIGSGKDEFDLDFFSRQVAPKIAGFYDFEFWSVTIPQLAHNEPAIRLAIQAVSSLHGEVEKHEGNMVSKVKPSILRNYNNAIRHMVQGTGERALINAVVAVLFVCLEFLAGNEDAAGIHITGGIESIREWQKRSRSSSPESSTSSASTSGSTSENDLIDELNSIFSRLTVHSKVFGKRMRTIEAPHQEPERKVYHFRSINEARDEGFMILGDGMNFISHGTPLSYSKEGARKEDYREQSTTVARALEWRRAYADFTRRERLNLSPVQLRAGNMVLCLVICTYIWASTCLSPYEEDYDKFTAEFQEVTDLANMILDVPVEYLCDNVGRFQIDMGLVPALHFVGSRCRVASIRTEAMRKLSQYHWREGLFDSFRSALFIKACMNLEENAKITLMGLEPHEVDDYLPCEGARIHFVGVDHEPETDTFLHSFYSKPYGAYGDWHVQQCSFPNACVIESDFTPSNTKAMPDSAYGLPKYFSGHAYESTGAFFPEGKPQRPWSMNGLTLKTDTFRIPNDKTPKLSEQSNGMFYFNLVDKDELEKDLRRSHEVLI